MNRLPVIYLLLLLWIPFLSGCSTSSDVITRAPSVPM